MFKFIIVLASIFSAFAFNPLGSATVSRMQMSIEGPSMKKVFGAALVASSLISMPVFAKEGVGAKISIFGNNDISSPFALGENREDPIYSPYSPFGNGEKATYNARRGGEEEIKFWKGQFAEGIKRTEKIPTFSNKKTWSEITSALTGSYSYNLREALLRLADASKSPSEATAAAKLYFSDLNDIFESATKKKGDLVISAYEKSVKDLEAFKKLAL